MGQEDKPEVLSLLQAFRALEQAAMALGPKDHERLMELRAEDVVRVEGVKKFLKDSHKIPGRGRRTEFTERLRHAAARLNALFLEALGDAHSLTVAKQQKAVEVSILQALKIPCQIQEGPQKGRPLLLKGFPEGAVRLAVERALQADVQDSVRARDFCAALLASLGFDYDDRHIARLVRGTPPEPLPGLKRVCLPGQGSFWTEFASWA